MRRARPFMFVLAIIVVLSVSGCTGLLQRKAPTRSTGTVIGRVTDQSAELGLANIRIEVEGTGLYAITNAAGSFQLTGVPVGPQKLVVTYPAPVFSEVHANENAPRLKLLGLETQGGEPVFMLGDEVVSPETVIEPVYATSTEIVTVQANATTPASIVLPVAGALENVALIAATPPLGTTLLSGNYFYVNFDAEVQYTLASQQEGIVALIVHGQDPNDSGRHTLTQLADRVRQGSSTVRFSGRFMPGGSGRTVHFMAALLDADGHVIAINSLRAYQMYDEKHPPRIEFGEVGTGYAVITIHDTNPVDFKEFQLHRYNLSMTPSTWQFVTSTDDPHARFLADNFAPSGHFVSYRVTMIDQDGQNERSSYTISTTIPNDWVSTVDQLPLIGDILLDPVRPVLYVTDTHYNRIVRVSTLTDRIIDVLPIGSLPERMAISSDATTLYVTNSGSDTIATVDLATDNINFIYGIRSPFDVALDEDRDRLYVTSNPGGLEALLTEIDLSSGEIVAQIPLPDWRPWYIIPAFDYGRIIVSPDQAIAPLIAFDTDDLSEVGRLEDRLAAEGFVHPSEGLVFLHDKPGATMLYDIRDLTEAGRFSRDVRGIAPDDGRFLTLRFRRYDGVHPMSQFLVFSEEADAEPSAITDYVSLGDLVPGARHNVRRVTTTADGSKTYLIATFDSRERVDYLRVVDHTERRQDPLHFSDRLIGR